MGKETVGVMSLGAIVKIVWDMRDDMRHAGASELSIAEATERIVRANWPFVREWKYLCQRCFDYGVEISSCPGDSTCDRSKLHGPHEFARPCWCSAGEKFRNKPKTESDFEAAGKVQKQRSFTRFVR
jgi:hypothetical protein